MLVSEQNILKEELPRSVGAQYATGDQWRNNSRKNEEMEAKKKQHPVVDVTGDRSKVQCCIFCKNTNSWNTTVFMITILIESKAPEMEEVLRIFNTSFS